MSSFWQHAVAAALGYLIGSIPFGFLIAKARGIDIRTVGSGNIGATNVFRMVGKVDGVAALLLDVLKGLVPVLVIAPWLGEETTIQIAAGLGAILGHAFSVFLRFKGGKAVATSLGVMVSLTPWATLIAVGVFIVTLAASRFVSLASMLAALALAVSAILLSTDPFGGSLPLSVFCLAVAALVLARHHSNIRRLLAGTERPFGLKR